MDPINVLCRLAPCRRARFLSALYGGAVARPGKDFLAALESLLGVPSEEFLYFGTDVELDILYAAFTIGSCDFPEAGKDFPIMDDRRGLLELDGTRFDAVLVYPGVGEGAPFVMVLVLSRMRGTWAGRRIRRIMNRLRHVFGNDGRALPLVRPRLVIMGPEHPGAKELSLWPAWVHSPDGIVPRLLLHPSDGELHIARCDKRGKVKRIGDHWTLTANPKP